MEKLDTLIAIDPPSNLKKQFIINVCLVLMALYFLREVDADVGAMDDLLNTRERYISVTRRKPLNVPGVEFRVIFAEAEIGAKRERGYLQKFMV